MKEYTTKIGERYTFDDRYLRIYGVNGSLYAKIKTDSAFELSDFLLACRIERSQIIEE